jgi:hypothetical protein
MLVAGLLGLGAMTMSQETRSMGAGAEASGALDQGVFAA